MMTREEEYYRLRENRDDSEREVEELETQLRDLEEDTDDWYAVFHELSAKESEAAYLNACLEDFEDEPYYSNEY